MKKLKSEKGAITIIVLVSVLFFVSFLISSYVIIANKVQTQKEIIARIMDAEQAISSKSFLRMAFTAIIPCGVIHNNIPASSHIPLK